MPVSRIVLCSALLLSGLLDASRAAKLGSSKLGCRLVCTELSRALKAHEIHGKVIDVKMMKWLFRRGVISDYRFVIWMKKKHEKPLGVSAEGTVFCEAHSSIVPHLDPGPSRLRLGLNLFGLLCGMGLGLVALAPILASLFGWTNRRATLAIKRMRSTLNHGCRIEILRPGTSPWARCPICSQKLEAEEATEVAVCPRCQVPSHLDCWNYQGGCPVYACDSSHLIHSS